jgi:hypothetical protein
MRLARVAIDAFGYVENDVGTQIAQRFRQRVVRRTDVNPMAITLQSAANGIQGGLAIVLGTGIGRSVGIVPDTAFGIGRQDDTPGRAPPASWGRFFGQFVAIDMTVQMVHLRLCFLLAFTVR